MCDEIRLIPEKMAVAAFSIRLVEACHRVSVLCSPPIPKDRLFLPKKSYSDILVPAQNNNKMDIVSGTAQRGLQRLVEKCAVTPSRE